MGAGRKTETYTLKEKSQHASSVNYSISARNLRKSELGGVIFGCKYNTFKECFQKQLFGLPAAHISYVKNIWPGLPLFLFNYSDRRLHGVFEAASVGRLNINPHGWTEDGSNCTPFAAQVKFQTRMQCQPLLEDQFGPIITDNYYEPRLFWFELDQDQTNKLISMFSSSPVTGSSSLPKNTAMQGTLLSNSRQKGGGAERPALDLNVANQNQANAYGGSCGDGIGLSGQSKGLEFDGRSYSSVLKNNGHSIGHSQLEHTGRSSLDTHGLSGGNGSLETIDNGEAVEHIMKISNVEQSYLPATGKMIVSLADSDVRLALGISGSEVESQLMEGIVNEEAVNNHEHGVGQPTEICLQSYCSAVNGQSSSVPQKKPSDLFEHSTTSAGRLEVQEIVSSELNLPTADQFNSTWEAPSITSGLNGQSNSSEDFIEESGQFDEQFECLKQQMEDLYFSVATDDNSCLPKSVPCESLSIANAKWEGRYLETRASESNTSQSDRSEIENGCLSEADLLSDVKLPDVQFIVDKILLEVNKLKLNQFKQEKKISSLEKELVESRRETKSLKQQLKTSECISLQEINLVIESESSVDESIVIVGGYNGLSYVSAMECYCPSYDSLESLCPMSSIRSFTSTVKLNDEVYVIGGLHDNLWCDTVESYNLVNNQWVTHPSLNQKKGSLAGISLNEKIFAIGGGNGVQCFSEVELFDLDVGSWIPTRSMLNKRFAPAAAEINGMIYVVGGYDGNDYLKSVERFDPRENSWSRVESMSTKRGCHSIAVLNEKLYAMGGYNGVRMISTVEVFDPRIGSWIMGESMNSSRGYSAAVVIGNSIFVIGGLSEKDLILDTVECYKEAHGWQSTNLKAIGKRCYFSAIPLSG